MNLYDKLKNIDRRIIFVLIGLSVLIPVLIPVQLKIHVSQPVQSLYDEIDCLPPGTNVLMAFDYGPSTMPEVHPMALAILRHVFSKDLKVISMALWPEGASLAQDALGAVAEEFHKAYGVDYVNLGFKAGGIVVIQAMGTSISAIFPTDYAGTPVETLPIMGKITNFGDIGIIVNLSAGDPGIRHWVMIAQARYQKKVGGGCTAVSAPAFYPYLQTGQLVGLLGGLVGAAEYETLVKHPDSATAGMSSQALSHAVIIIFILIGNSTFFVERRRARK
jgi:hypothetical protein